MQHIEDLQKLIERAATNAGSKSKLARALGVSPQKINSWSAGICTCTPEDRARLAGFAREDATQELIRATLEKHAGTLRGEQLAKLLGKVWLQTGGATAGALFSLGSAVFLTMNSLDVLRCI